MTSRAVVALTLFAVAFAVARYIPHRASSSRTPLAGERRLDAATMKGPLPAQPSLRSTSVRVVALPPAAAPSSPWLAHVRQDPEHHAPDANRISQAVFSNGDIVMALHECAALFAPLETRLRLRTTVTISRETIEVGPVESIEVTDGVELTAAGRACVLAAFSRVTSTTPAHPDVVKSFHGPYDLFASVVGDSTTEATRER